MNSRRLAIAFALVALLVAPVPARAGGGHFTQARHHLSQARAARTSGNRSLARQHLNKGRIARTHGLLSIAKKSGNQQAVAKLQKALKAYTGLDSRTPAEQRTFIKGANKLSRDAWNLIKSTETALAPRSSTAVTKHKGTTTSDTSSKRRSTNRSKLTRRTLKRESGRYGLKARNLKKDAKRLERDARQLSIQASHTGDSALALKASAKWASASRLRISSYKAEAKALHLAADASGNSARVTKLRERAAKLERKAGRLHEQVKKVVDSNPTLKSNEAVKNAAASLDPTHHSGSGDATHTASTSGSTPKALPAPQAKDTETPQNLAKDATTHQQKATPKAADPNATYGRLKAYLRNKDLGSAVSVLKSMERNAQVGGVRGIWRKFQVRRARRKLRKAAVSVGKGSLRDGTAVDYYRQSWRQDAQLKEYKKELLAQNPGQEHEVNAYIAELARNNQSQLAAAIRQDPSGYRQARRALRYLENTRKKHKGLTKVIAGIGSLVFGSPRGAQRKLDRSLIKEARHLVKTRGVDGAIAARLMLTEAKSRGLGRSIRFRLTKWKARRSLGKTIRKAIKEGDPMAVREAWLLREAYGVDKKGAGYRLSDRQAKSMQKDIRRAEVKFVDVLSKQAEWMVKHPRMAEQYGYTPELAAQVNRIARQHASQLISDGGSVSGRTARRMDRTDRKLNARKPNLLVRIAKLPLKIALLPLKAIKFMTWTQIQHLRYSKTGGVPPPPMNPGRLQNLMNSYMPESYAQQGQQEQVAAAQQGGGPKNPMDAL